MRGLTDMTLMQLLEECSCRALGWFVQEGY